MDAAVAPPLPSAISFLGAPAYVTAHSRALCSNSAGLRISMPATSASCGSFGSGVLRRDWSEMRADLMVRTGDHCDDSVSKQIAPVCELTLGCQILVSNFMTGGRKGYSLGILMST